MLMLHALIPKRRYDKTRFQITVEVDGGSDTILRPHAIRAASGHSDFDYLDPVRVASVANDALLQAVPGMFHMTTVDRVRSIIQQGLLPGSGVSQGGRHDIHMSPFAPLDGRNTIMHNKLSHIRLRGECWCVISINVSKLAPGSLRYCPTNGVFLCDKPIGSETFDGIWQIVWILDDWQQRWIFEPRIESMNVIGYRGGQRAKPSRVA